MECQLSIGKYCLITPGVRIMAAESIIIGDACMFAHGVYILMQIGMAFMIEVNQ